MTTAPKPAISATEAAWRSRSSATNLDLAIADDERA